MSDILTSYDRSKIKYQAFSKMLASLISSLMLAEGIKIHSVTNRVKSRESLEKKINNKDKYNKIDEITDIVGLRVITHFSDEVDKVARLIEQEFTVDKENTIDKRTSLEPEKFGYLSLHYVILLSTPRLELFEYKSYEGIKAEIQIRSILQHTWAEIEHDIGYKSSIEVPKVIKRQFSRLAGLLELADQEFLSIKNSLIEYQSNISQTVWFSKDEDYRIDKITLREYLKVSEIVKEMQQAIMKSCSTKFDPDADYDGEAIKYLNTVNIISIKELDNAFKMYKDEVINRTIWISKKYKKSLPIIRPLEILAVYLPQIIAFEKSGMKGLKDYFYTATAQTVENIPQELFDEFALSITNQKITEDD